MAADMLLTCLQQFCPVKDYEKLKTDSEKEKPVPQISILVDHLVSQSTEPENNLVQNDMVVRRPYGYPDSCSSSPRKVAANISGTLADELPRFGPFYGVDTDTTLVKSAKDDAWNHVQEITEGKDPSLNVHNLYLTAIKEVESIAKRSYDHATVKKLKSKFRKVMLVDGCFFLQLALYILGYSKQLGYSEQHAYFVAHNTKKWIGAMFHVGNQIPCVVLHALMKQSFFQDVIRGETWNPPLDLPRLALYLVVVHPALKKNAPGRLGIIFSKLNWKKTPHLTEHPCPSDVLHCLHTLVLGLWHNPLDSPDSEIEEDLESGTEKLQMKKKFPSASKMQQLGIRLRKADWGIRKIHFRKCGYLDFGYLYVPPFRFDVNTGPMLTNLKSYEEYHQQVKAKREVSAYIRFMRDLIRTPEDVSLLEHRGIVQVKGLRKETLPELLSRMVSSKEVSFTPYLSLTKLEVEQYKTPRLRYLISWGLIFTLVQTAFTILQYLEQPRR